MRWSLSGVILLAAVWFLWRNSRFLADGWEAVRGADTTLVAGSVAAVAVALFAMAEVMHLLLRAAGAEVNRRQTNGLVLAANAWSVTVPGGVAFATALSVRRQLAWGASPIAVSWQVLMSGAMSALGLATLGVASIFFVGAEVTPLTLVGPLVAVALLTVAMRWATRNTDRLGSGAVAAIRWFNRVTHSADPDRWTAGVSSTLTQLTAVRVTPWQLGAALVWSLLNWVAELLCLWLAARAVGAELGLAGALLAFVSGKIIGTVQATPGGIGPVEAVLTGALTAAGLPATQALAAVVVYRAVSLVLVAAVGWVVFLWTSIRGGDRGGSNGGSITEVAAPAGIVGGTFPVPETSPEHGTEPEHEAFPDHQ